MGRKAKLTVEYFPHYAVDSKTKYMLENRWGNNGYAFWFKLLELLCRTDGHFYPCAGVADYEYLLAITKVDESIGAEILNKLAEAEKIDPELWKQDRIIWCQSLVDNIAYVYDKRKVSAPEKPFPTRKSPEKTKADDFTPILTQNSPIFDAEGVEDDPESDTDKSSLKNISATEKPISGAGISKKAPFGAFPEISGIRNTRSEVNRIEENRREVNLKEKTIGDAGASRGVFKPPRVEEVVLYCQERQNGIDATEFVDFYASKGWYVGKNKMKDWKAAIRTWEKRRREGVMSGANPGPNYGPSAEPEVPYRQISKKL